jgi:hypothetical protein
MTRYRSDNSTFPSTESPGSDNTAARHPTTGLSDGPTMVWPERDSQVCPAPGTVQGDDYSLGYYADGYPKLPACLDRKKAPAPATKHAYSV